MCSKTETTNYTGDYWDKIALLKQKIQEADAVIIGAGAGLSTSAGLDYGGARFGRLFPDFIAKYPLTDMYSTAFYPFPTPEEFWAYFSRHIYHNRYESEVNSCYETLLKLVEDKNYFVLTTNADHLFIRNGFEKARLFYTQGDYGLFQCSVPCHQKTYDNRDIIDQMVAQQRDCKIPSELLPKCPRCGAPMEVNLRKDDTFVEDEGWDLALKRYEKFLKENLDKKVLFLELGVGYNTPGIIKYPFWQMTYQHPNAYYVTLNASADRLPRELDGRSMALEGDIFERLQKIGQFRDNAK